MTQKDKELLLSDLCTRLPYGVICSVAHKKDGKLVKEDMNLSGMFEDGNFYFTDEMGSTYSGNYIPYLRPMSSITEEEMVDYGRLILSSDKIYAFSDYRKTGKGFVNIYTVNRKTGKEGYTFQVNGGTMLYDGYVGIDWLNANHFDYRGLIEKGLALEAPEGMYNK